MLTTTGAGSATNFSVTQNLRAITVTEGGVATLTTTSLIFHAPPVLVQVERPEREGDRETSPESDEASTLRRRTRRRRPRRTRHPQRNRVIVLLSVTAGLRACEIAALQWDMVLTARHEVGTILELPGWAAKKGGGRRIPFMLT